MVALVAKTVLNSSRTCEGGLFDDEMILSERSLFLNTDY